VVTTHNIAFTYHINFCCICWIAFCKKNKTIYIQQKEEEKHKRVVFEELERRRREAKERMEYESRLKNAFSGDLSSFTSGGSGGGRTSPFPPLSGGIRPNSPYQATLGNRMSYDDDEEEEDNRQRLNYNKSSGGISGQKNKSSPPPLGSGSSIKSSSISSSDDDDDDDENDDDKGSRSSVNSSCTSTSSDNRSFDPIKRMIHGGKPVFSSPLDRYTKERERA
jgi:hypothetical protein